MSDTVLVHGLVGIIVLLASGDLWVAGFQLHGSESQPQLWWPYRVVWEEAGTPESLLCISNELLQDIKERQFVEPALLKIWPYVRSKRKHA